MESTGKVLREDYVTVPGQRFALISFIGPTAQQKADKWGMKIRGVFNTKDEANEHVKELMKSDPSFDVYMVDMYKWLLIPPDREQIKDVHYQEEYLEKMVQGYMENQKQAREYFELRKEAVMKEGLDKHLLPEERLPPPPGLVTSASEVMEALTQEDPTAQPSTSGSG